MEKEQQNVFFIHEKMKGNTRYNAAALLDRSAALSNG